MGGNHLVTALLVVARIIRPLGAVVRPWGGPILTGLAPEISSKIRPASLPGLIGTGPRSYTRVPNKGNTLARVGGKFFR